MHKVSRIIEKVVGGFSSASKQSKVRGICLSLAWIESMSIAMANEKEGSNTCVSVQLEALNPPA